MIQHTSLTPEMFPQVLYAFFGTIRDITYPTQGWTSNVAVIDCARGKFVIKQSHGEQYSAWLAQEYKVLQALSSTSLPIPHLHQFVQQYSSDTPACWLVMDYLPGESLRSLLMDEADQTNRQSLLREFGCTLATIHKQAAPPDLLPGQKPWVEDMLERAHYYFMHYQTEGSSELLA
ncbi:MAG TPA: phosphotransferase [Ktedonobacteraceae bacterium]|nr:phosphotransferase [Ktedonobacteraceae bacterium]